MPDEQTVDIRALLRSANAAGAWAKREEEPGAPTGGYRLQLKAADVRTNKKMEPMIVAVWVILDGEYQGQEIREFLTVSKSGSFFVHKWFNSLGVASPSDPGAIADVVAALQNAAPVIDAGVIKDGSFHRVEIKRVLMMNGSINGPAQTGRGTAVAQAASSFPTSATQVLQRPASLAPAVTVKFPPGSWVQVAGNDSYFGQVQGVYNGVVRFKGIDPGTKQETLWDMPEGQLSERSSPAIPAPAPAPAPTPAPRPATPATSPRPAAPLQNPQVQRDELRSQIAAFLTSADLPVSETDTLETLIGKISMSAWSAAQCADHEHALLKKLGFTVNAGGDYIPSKK